ncbi:MAG: alpha-1,2-fucosyltransferase [Nitrosomonadales bacterium]|nr:alpha-1,2-fucosyltransferase [Nitrosomonadales bacterium]
MIISNIIGGLGNQMFQYATARAVSIDLGAKLVLDTSDFVGYRLHQGFELKRVFECQADIATDADTDFLLRWRKAKLARRLLRKLPLPLLCSKHVVFEPTLQYWPGIKDVLDDSYLMGYWQSEKYFAHHAQTIRKDFSFKTEFSTKNAEIASHICGTNAVSLHIRRGDYVSHARTKSTLGVCSIEYYQAAITQISEQVSTPEFFIFSDDMAWVKGNFQLDFPSHYIDHNNGEDSFNDMRLMSLCQHHIIANSSFSWWGAWLNPSLEKFVFAPQNWFANGTDTSDLIPANWIRL